jgi:hypothetical protein
MDLTGVSVGDYFRRNGRAYHYVGITATTLQPVVAIDTRGYGGTELPQAIAAGALTIDSDTYTLLPLDPTAGNLTLTGPADGHDRVIMNLSSVNSIILPDGAVVRPGEKYQISLDPVDDWISSPIYADSGIVVGSGSTLPDPNDYAVGKLWLLHNQLNEQHNGWYATVGTVPALNWVQRTTTATGVGVGIGTSLPTLTVGYDGVRIFILHSQVVPTDDGIYEIVANAWTQRLD